MSTPTIGQVFKHVPSDYYFRLIRIGFNVNTYLIVDENNNPIMKKCSWSTRPVEQHRLVTGFDNLELWKNT